MEESHFLSAAAFSDARQCSEPPPWLGHIPFAFWIAEAIQPAIFVELGTYSGNSYFAFCQAVCQLGLRTRCWAVDTWDGDLHSGLYGEEVYRQVAEVNQREYADFSSLIRSTFDEALSEFQDHSIDLLHIDGLHTYSAVKHDFEAWLPKLSDKAVVLLHDTNEHQADFGVYLFFDELKKRYPTFEFLHSSGLGVVGVGEQLAGRVRQLLEVPAASHLAEKIRACYARLGQQPIDRLTLSIQRKVSEEIQREIILFREQNYGLQQIGERAEQEIHELRDRATAAEAELEMALEANTILTEQNLALALERDALTTERDALTSEITHVQASLSWRILNGARRSGISWFRKGTPSRRCLSTLGRFIRISRNEGFIVACRRVAMKVGRKSLASTRGYLRGIHAITERGSRAARRFAAVARRDGLSVAFRRAWRSVRANRLPELGIQAPKPPRMLHPVLISHRRTPKTRTSAGGG